MLISNIVNYTDALFEYTPNQIKLATTGTGAADKHQVQQMTKYILGLKSVPKPDDAADALAVAITHAYTNTSAATSSMSEKIARGEKVRGTIPKSSEGKTLKFRSSSPIKK